MAEIYNLDYYGYQVKVIKKDNEIWISAYDSLAVIAPDAPKYKVSYDQKDNVIDTYVSDENKQPIDSLAEGDMPMVEHCFGLDMALDRGARSARDYEPPGLKGRVHRGKKIRNDAGSIYVNQAGVFELIDGVANERKILVEKQMSSFSQELS